MKQSTKKDGLVLLLSDARGIYIPRDFMDFENWQGITEWQREQLQAPDNEFYWDAWESVLNNATYKDGKYTYHLMQDGNLWACCSELMTEEEKLNFGFNCDDDGELCQDE